MRILSQQINLLGRAIGNVLIPMLSAILPYAIAAAKALRTVVDSIAAFFGYRLTEIDYDAFGGMEVGASAAEDIEDAMGGAAASAKRMKDYVLGIDELNIIRPDEPTGSGGGAVSSSLGFESLELPQYDFLAGLSKQADELIPKMEKLVKVLGLVAGALVAAKLVKGIIDLVGWFKALGKWFGTLSDGTVTLLKGLGNVAAVVGSLGMSFYSGYSFMYDFISGADNLGASLALALGGFAMAEVVLGTILGPIGLAAGAFVALAGAIIGAYKANEDLNSQLVANTFYDDVGVPIGDLTQGYIDLMDAITDANQPIIDGWASIQEGQGAIEGTTRSIFELAHRVTLGVSDIQTELPKIKDAFTNLYNDTEQLLQDIGNNIYDALAGPVGRALEELGYSLPEIGLTVSAAVQDSTVEIERLKAETAAAWAEVESEALDASEALAITLENAATINQLAGNNTDGLLEFSDALAKLIPDDINWKTDDLAGVFSEMTTAYETAEGSIRESTSSLVEQFTLLRDNMLAIGDAEAAAELERHMSGITEAADKQLSDLGGILDQYVGTLQGDLIRTMQDEYDAAMSEWDSLHWIRKAMYNNDSAAYVSDILGKYKQEIVSPIVQGMQDAFGDHVSPDTQWADEVMTKMLGALFQTTITVDSFSGAVHFSTRLTGDLQAMIEQAVAAVDPSRTLAQADALGRSLGEGYANGIFVEIPQAQAAAGAMGTESLRSLKDSINSNSPSVAAAAEGYNFVTGYAKGIEDNIGLATFSAQSLGLKTLDSLVGAIDQNAYKPIDAFRNMLNKMLSLADQFATNFAETINRTLDEMADAFSETKVSDSRVSVGRMTTFSVPALAGGGRVSSGQLFLANENHNPELVGRFGSQTGVMNNDQIVTSVERGVYNAVSDAIRNNADTFGAKVSVQIGDKEIYDANKRAERAAGYQIAPAHVK